MDGFEMNIADYCQGCAGFEVEAKREQLYLNDRFAEFMNPPEGPTWVISCKNRKKCEQIAKFISKKKEGEN